MGLHKVLFFACILAAQVFLSIQQGICTNSGHTTDGTGYVTHPYRCEQYVQCFYNPQENLNIGITRTCGTGLHWNPTDKRCEHPSTAGCTGDYCNSMCESHKMKNNCRGYYDCNGTRSVSQCCPEGKIFVWGSGCIEDVNNECNIPCEISPNRCKESEFKRRPNWGHPGSFDFTFFGTTFWFGQLCEHNEFDAVTSECTAPKGHRCDPDRHVDLSDASTAERVLSGGAPGISTTGGRYTFNGVSLGRGEMIHVDATSTEGNEPFTIKFSYRANVTSLPRSYATILVSANLKCAARRYGTFHIYVHNGFLYAGIRTPGGRNDNVGVLLRGMGINSFKEVTVTYDKDLLTIGVKADNQLNVESVKASEQALFPCGFDFGSTEDYDSFVGEFRMISLSSCTPARLY